MAAVENSETAAYMFVSFGQLGLISKERILVMRRIRSFKVDAENPDRLRFPRPLYPLIRTADLDCSNHDFQQSRE